MKRLLTTSVVLLIAVMAISQVAPNKYWVKFSDKNDSPYSINNPEAFLSQRAIDRRNTQGISIVENDLPVNQTYIDGVSGTGATVLTISKWFNSVTVEASSQSIIDAVNALSYVESVEKANGNESATIEKEFFAREAYQIENQNSLKSANVGNSYDYGQAFNQIEMLNGIGLHDMGYDGEGMIIAVLDAGFQNVDDLSAFDSLWMNNQILGVRDFVSPYNPDLYDSHYHGAMVLSTMGANLPGEIVGTAPKADYWLIRTEDGDSEYLIEELNWVSGAELADSVGADVINSSLGYSTFDDSDMDHSYDDMDGNSTPITIGADIAASKGILVVNSAGNSGNDPWHYIGAPADGNEVFTIGAVDGSGAYAGFSSVGPTADGRTKPNVVAQGSGSTVIDPWSGSVSFGSGTSFSSPITAGMVACLWQANPLKTNMEIMAAIESSGSLANNPTDLLGFGIPDYMEANSILTVIENNDAYLSEISVYPNPFDGDFTISLNEDNVLVQEIELLDITGKRIELKQVEQGNNSVQFNKLQSLPKGVYILKVKAENITITRKIIKS